MTSIYCGGGTSKQRSLADEHDTFADIEHHLEDESGVYEEPIHSEEELPQHKTRKYTFYLRSQAQNFTCEYCQKVLKYRSKYEEHLRTHTGERPFSCGFCDANFTQRGALKQHERIHTGIKPHCCYFCDKNFRTSATLNIHMKKHPPSIETVMTGYVTEFEEQEIKMEEEEYEYVYEEDVEGNEDGKPSAEMATAPSEAHEYEYFYEDPGADGNELSYYQMEDQDEGPYQYVDEIKHEEFVEDEGMFDEMGEPYILPEQQIQVNEKFRTKKTKSHIDEVINFIAHGVSKTEAEKKTKAGPTTKTCEFCGIFLKYPSKIKAHMRTHTGEKPFICEICGTGFAMNTTLQMHVRRHLKETVYHCTYPDCEKSYVSGALLNYHIQKRHYAPRKFACLRECGALFFSNKNREKHEMNCLHPIIEHDEHLVYTEAVNPLTGQTEWVYAPESWEEENMNIELEEESLQVQILAAEENQPENYKSSFSQKN